jgi:hypothetical protein
MERTRVSYPNDVIWIISQLLDSNVTVAGGKNMKSSRAPHASHLPFFSIFEGQEGKSWKDISDKEERRRPYMNPGLILSIALLLIESMLAVIELVGKQKFRQK